MFEENFEQEGRSYCNSFLINKSLLPQRSRLLVKKKEEKKTKRKRGKMNVRELQEISKRLKEVLGGLGIEEVDEVEFCLQDGKFWNYVPRDIVLIDGSVEKEEFDLLYAEYDGTFCRVPTYPETKRNGSLTEGETIRVALREYPGAKWYAIFSRETLRIAGETISGKKTLSVFLP